MTDANYLVAGSKPWNRSVFREAISKLHGRWHFAGRPEDLGVAKVQALGPRYIFFLHWSWKVDEQLVRDQECVCFHMTDVPYGRGGSPLQNLILRGHRETELTALRMSPEFDAGPVYLKRPLSLQGSAEEIYIRSSLLAAEMIAEIVQNEPKPVPQVGEVVRFRRRHPAESEIPESLSLEGLHDFIRMLDAEGYPRAFLVHRGFRYEFGRAALHDGRVVADVSIQSVTQDETDEGIGRSGSPRR